MDIRCREIIANEFERCIDNTITRLTNEETHRPFHAALLSKEALVWSRFERSFSTSFGQRVIEQISKAAAIAGGATEAINQRATIVQLSTGRLAAINRHVDALRGGGLGRAPKWETDLAAIASSPDTGSIESIRVISDLWWKRDGIDHYMSIKTVKPNIDQTAKAKNDLLKLSLNNPDCRVFYGLYYNPYGELRKDYKWSPPMGIFDFLRDPVILIGREYWDTLGGTGFYNEVLEIAEEVGARTRENIRIWGTKDD